MHKKTRLPMVEVARPKKRRAARPASGRQATAVSSADLPGWRALSDVTPHGRARKSSNPFASLTTSRFAAWLCGIGILATLYVGHVHGTQETFEELHALQKENLKLSLERDRLRGELDLATGPTVIYPKAHELGLREGFDYGPTISLTNK